MCNRRNIYKVTQFEVLRNYFGTINSYCVAQLLCSHNMLKIFHTHKMFSIHEGNAQKCDNSLAILIMSLLHQKIVKFYENECNVHCGYLMGIPQWLIFPNPFNQSAKNRKIFRCSSFLSKTRFSATISNVHSLGKIFCFLPSL